MSRSAYPTRLHDHLGNEIRLPPKPIAVGGEGAVFDVLGKPHLVAKLYHDPQSKERCDKLRAMAKLCGPDLLKIAAWPIATLSNGSEAVVEGFVMPKIVDHNEIHDLYGVANRKRDFPEADWGFLLHTARNCAIAFEVVHQHGHVVGDVNQKNIMVSKKGIVSLVDCDSFQVTEGSRIFRCEVGLAEYTPPELHGKKFGTLDRTANHDLFGLSVLIFHLLMMGRHPFSGVSLISDDMSIEKAIREGLYAYTRNPTKLKPPPNVPPISLLDVATIGLFERAFGSLRRPTATEWRNVLDASMRQLLRCKNDPMHTYLAASGSCPWCQFYAVTRVILFAPGKGAAGTIFSPEEIDSLIRKLAAMQISFTSYARPQATLPVHVSLPPGLKSVKKPTLLNYPAPPAPLQKPVLKSIRPFPLLLSKPAPIPLPPPLVIPHSPALKPHPAAPARLPRPQLQPIPLPPVYPQIQELGPPDPFLSKLSLYGMIGGLLVFLIAQPVGVIMTLAFGIWWVVMMGTENTRRGLAHRSRVIDHKSECARMDSEYAEQIQPIEEENKCLLEAWKAANESRVAEHTQLCLAVDQENRSKLEPWESEKASLKASYLREFNQIDQANRRAIAAWEAENASRQADYDKVRQELEQENQQLIAAWEGLTAFRNAEHMRACGDIDAHNERLVAEWEAANATWIAEERRWRDRVAIAEAEVGRLESEVPAQRSATTNKFMRRKDEANRIVADLSRVKRDYEVELWQAEGDSKKIQLKEHLSKSFIRNAKLQGISSDRIFSLESFGIETANEVYLLSTLKVPGIGPVLSGRLFAWRDSLISSFRPKQGLPASEKNRIANRYSSLLLPLRQSIHGAINELDAINGAHNSRETELFKAIAMAVQNAAVAKAHLNAMKVG